MLSQKDQNFNEDYDSIFLQGYSFVDVPFTSGSVLGVFAILP
jgi:hypothetical protein